MYSGGPPGALIFFLDAYVFPLVYAIRHPFCEAIYEPTSLLCTPTFQLIGPFIASNLSNICPITFKQKAASACSSASISSSLISTSSSLTSSLICLSSAVRPSGPVLAGACDDHVALLELSLLLCFADLVGDLSFGFGFTSKCFGCGCFGGCGCFCGGANG